MDRTTINDEEWWLLEVGETHTCQKFVWNLRSSRRNGVWKVKALTFNDGVYRLHRTLILQQWELLIPYLGQS